MSDALTNLAAAIVAAAGNPIDLTSEFLTDGMADATVGVPDGMDTALAKAFGTPKGSGLTVSVDPANVGGIADNKFSVTQVGLMLLTHQLDRAATLEFGLETADGKQVLTVGVATVAAGWEWSWLSIAAADAPFTYLSVSSVSLGFATKGGKAEAVQSFAATLTPPAMLQPAVLVIQNLGFPTLALPLSGTMDFSSVDGDNILLPVSNLKAPFAGGNLTLGYLSVSRPSFGLSIGEAFEIDEEGGGADVGPEDEDGPVGAETAAADDLPLYEQQAAVYFSVDLALKPSNGPSVSYELRAQAATRPDGKTFTFSLAPNEDSALFTPETAIQLVDNSGSFFSGVPPQLQQFLGGIGLRGMTVEGLLAQSSKISSVTLTIGADPTRISPDNKFVLFDDPSNKDISFAIADFYLNWQALFGEKTRFNYLIAAEFELLPKVFTTRDGKPYGIFDVSINSSYQILARFDGQAKMSDLFRAVAGISLPSQFEVTISNVNVAIDVPAKRYVFNAGIDVVLGFPSAANPLISLSDGQLILVASTPAAKSGDGTTLATGAKTNYAGSFQGQLTIGPVSVTALVAYVNPAVYGTDATAHWKLHAALVHPVDVNAIVKQYFDPTGGFILPTDLFAVSLTIQALEFNATIPSSSGKKGNGAANAVAVAATAEAMTYDISATFAWSVAFGSLFTISSPKTSLKIAYDGAKPEGAQYSGNVSAIARFDFMQSDVELDFMFQKSDKGAWDNTLAVTWEGLTATYKTIDRTLTFTLKGWSLGTLVQRLVRTLGDPYFTLESPWDLLNDIPLDGLFLTLNLDAKPNEPTIVAGYKLASPLDLGFIKIKALDFSRKPDDKGNTKITLSLDAEIPGPFRAVIDSGDPAQKQAWDNLLGQSAGPAPKKGQPVDDLPKVPGRGNQYFNMPILVLGQRVGIAGHARFDSTYNVLKALSGKNTPSTDGKTNPISPKSDDNSPPGTPYYDARNNWTIASHLQLLKTGDDWTVDLMFVFSDPNLYGLRLALAGEKAKVLGNLVIDIIYKKITDDIGLYQIEFTFPDSIRNLNFGTVSIVLPQLGIKIYTNGDFLIDVGFPYNLDFQRSFSISTIVFAGPIPIPLTGAGGFYFGKLSSATATQVPTTNKGTFDPVIVFGFGLQLGLGYNFIKGPLKAGFALTVFGIVEGVLAPWHSYAVAHGDDNAVQDNYYFKISGTVGIIGLLYGEINFAIISASLQVRLTLSITLTYESYRPVPIMVRATVDVSLKVKIDLGIFSISISLSFHADVSTKFTIPAPNPNAPWDMVEARLRPLAAAMARTGIAAARADVLEATVAACKSIARTGARPKLNLLASPAATLLSNEGATDPKSAQGAFVLLLAMDAPDATDPNAPDDSSFQRLLADFLPWLIDSLKGVVGDTLDLSAATAETVTEADLTAYVDRLADLANPPISFDYFLKFLSSFDVDIAIPSDANKAKNAKDFASSVLFPVFDGLSISATQTPPGGGAGQTASVEFKAYVTANETYRANVAKLFDALSAKVGETKSDQPSARLAAAEVAMSMAAFVFVDAFNLIGRQMLQAALTAMRDYAYPLASGNSMAAVFAFLKAHRQADLSPDPGVLTEDETLLADLVQANLTTALTEGQVLKIPGLIHVVQSADTLASIATGFAGTTGVTAKTLILINAGIDPTNPTAPPTGSGTRCLVPGVKLTVVGRTTTTGPGATFATLAAGLGYPDVPTMADQAGDALGTIQGLLLPGAILLVPTLSYTIAAGDTLGPIADQFNLAPVDLFAPVPPDLASPPPNWTVPLFDTKARSTIPVPELTTLTIAEVWSALLAAKQVPQIAGMVSRFLIYGLRLPSDPTNPKIAGPTLSGGFLYPTTQSEYGLYQLIGQQIPVPDYTVGAGYEITLSRSDDLGFIMFDGTAGTKSPPLKLDAAYEKLSYAVTYARAGGFQPSPSFEILSPSIRVAKSFSIQSYSRWAAAGVGQVVAAVGGTAPAHPDPVIWSLPNALIQSLGLRQAALTRRFGEGQEALAQVLAFMPAYRPTVTTNDPASGAAKAMPIDNYAWATRVDIAIRKLPPSPNPAGNAGLSGVTYEVLGPSPEAAVLLERLLSAMDSLGVSAIRDLFLLYPDNSTGSPRLASPATSDFVAYLTQTNLSTETNPAGAVLALAITEAPYKPRGIVNGKDEVVKLLWELSTVRSGGYFLTWCDLVSGGGLPDPIFDDNGGATLTLVIAYDVDTIRGRVTNFVNSFLTVGETPRQGAAVSVAGQSTISPTHRPRALVLPTDSLDTLATAYGVGIGPIAEANTAFPIPSGTKMPVRGIVHLISPSDAAVGGSDAIYQRVRDYYVNDSVPGEEITVRQIKDANNNAVAAEGVALFIPDVHYQTPDASQTLTSITAYFGVTLDQLAVSAGDVAGIFGNGQVGAVWVTMDSLTYDLQNYSGSGNIGFEISRIAQPGPASLVPPGMTQMQADAAQVFLYELYNVVSAGLRANAMFSKNDAALPFGPQDHNTDRDPDTMRDPRRRAEALQRMGAVTDYLYRNTLNIATNALVDPGSTPPAVPNSSGANPTNPYIGVGTLAQLALQWRDVFGNIVVTPWTTPPAGYSGALNGQAVPVLYSDRLIGLGAWPNLQATYAFAPGQTTPTLTIALALSTNAYQGTSQMAASVLDMPDWQRRARDDLATYLAIWWQLNQNYKAPIDLPWCDGPAVTVSLNISLVAPGAVLPAGDPVLGKLNAYVEAAIGYLADRVQGKTPTPPSATMIAQPIPYTALSTSNVIPLSVGVTLARPTLLVEPSVASLVDGHTVTSAILPIADKDGDVGQSAYTKFAADFETAFKVDGVWSMRVGAGIAKPDETPNGRAQTLWAVRLSADAAAKPTTGIAYRVLPDPGFYAPKPLARTLTAGCVTVKTRFNPDGDTQALPGGGAVTPSYLGDEQTLTLTGVDLNALFVSCLKTVDSFLLPTYVTPAFLAQAAPGTDPLTDGPLGSILKSKATLADAISATVLPVLSTSANDYSTLAASKEKLRQALLNELAPAYSVSAVVTFGVDDVGGAPSGPAGPATLYGQPMAAKTVAIATPATDETTWSISTARISLGNETPPAPDPTRRDPNPVVPPPIEPRLAFLFNSKNAAEAAYVGLPLNFPLSHMEHDRAHVPGIEGYTQSSWISFISGPIEQPLNDGKVVDIPVVLRALPEPPTMQGQASEASHAKPSNPAELAEWDYTFDYIYRRAAQDTALISVAFNRETDLKPMDSTADRALLTQLVQFTTIYPQIEAVFDSTLAPLTVADISDPTSAKTKLAKAAVAGYAELLGDLTAAFDAWARPTILAASIGGGPTPMVICSFELLSQGDPKSGDPSGTTAQNEILSLTVDFNSTVYTPRYDPAAHTLIVDDPNNPATPICTLPAPRIEIPGTTANWLAPGQCYSDTAFYGFDYTVDGSDPPQKLTYGQARDIADRKIRFQSLNLFLYQDAWAAISIERNKYLVPSEAQKGGVTTTPEFVFASPVVRFADPTIPELSFGGYDLSGLTPTNPPGSTTSGYLDAFFTEMTVGGLGAPIEVAMEARYNYQQAGNAGLPRSVLPVAYLPPTSGVASPTGAPAAVLSMGDFVDAWRVETGVTTAGKPLISFTLTVFNGQTSDSSKQPILRVAELGLDASKVPVK